MAKEINHYVRVYRSVRNDTRFEHAYSCDACLAAYLRLLLDADACYPMPASIPLSLKKHARDELQSAGIIELQPADCYVVHGLTAERLRRSEQARENVSHRQDRATVVVRSYNDGNNGGSNSGNTGDVLARAPNQTEPNQDEPNLARARAYPGGDFDALDVYHELTLYRPWGVFSGDKLKAAQADYGDTIVADAIRAEHATDPDRKTLLDRTLARLARDADHAQEAERERRRAVKPPPLPEETEEEKAGREKAWQDMKEQLKPNIVRSAS